MHNPPELTYCTARSQPRPLPFSLPPPPRPQSHRHPHLQEGYTQDVPSSSNAQETLPHSVDAIYTELEDELIAVKNEFSRRGAFIAQSRPANNMQQSLDEELLKLRQIWNSVKEFSLQSNQGKRNLDSIERKLSRRVS